MHALKEKQQAIATYAGDPLGDPRIVEDIKTDEFARQGDVYIVRLESLPAGLKLTQETQLAPGTTQGSRHTVGPEVSVYRRPEHGHVETVRDRDLGDGARAIGHVIDYDERFTVSHPEHADVSLPPGPYQVYHQVDAATGQRVRD